LLEFAHKHCVAHELAVLGLDGERQRPVPLESKDTTLDCGYRLDLVVEEALVAHCAGVERFAFADLMQS
jgi:GxxExxY protein